MARSIKAIATLDAVPRLAPLVDEARELIVNARSAGLEPSALVVASAEFEALRRAKSFEDRERFPLQLLGVEVVRAEEHGGRRLVGLRFD